MELQDFMHKVEEKVRERLGKGYTVGTDSIIKNNGTEGHAVIISSRSNMSPCIYVDGFYEDYMSGRRDIEDTAEEIETIYRVHKTEGSFNTSIFTDYDNVRKRLSGRLVSTEKNRMFLESVPHRDFLDLSLVYYVELDETESPLQEAAGIRVSACHLEMWGVDEKDLYQAVCRNMADSGGGRLERMDELLQLMAGIHTGSGRLNPMYVLSSRGYRNGAVWMMDGHMLETAADTMGTDFAVLPSSIHEVLLVPVCGEDEKNGFFLRLADMVREVNDTQVDAEEILSYHVYLYRRETGKLEIAA